MQEEVRWDFWGREDYGKKKDGVVSKTWTEEEQGMGRVGDGNKSHGRTWIKNMD